MATYSDGTTEAMVGDVVETKDQSALLPTGCYRVVLVNGPFHVKLGAITASEHLNTDCGIWLSDRFTLIQRDGNFISRKQEPPMSEPLVKWPEESEELGSLKWGTLFVMVNDPHVPCVARSHGDYVPVAGECAGAIRSNPKSSKVRRIQFNPANKEPVFIVI